MRKTALALSIPFVLALLASCSPDHNDAHGNAIQQVSNVSSIEGAVVVNASGQRLAGGVALNISGNTKITIDGSSASLGDLQPGMVVLAEGGMVGDGSFNCTSVASHSALSGRIESIGHHDHANNTLAVAGKTVAIDGNSHLVKQSGSGFATCGFTDFNVGDLVTVCGYYSQDGSYCVATRLCQWSSDASVTTTVTAKGICSNLGGETFTAGGQTVHYRQASVTGTLANGANVVAVCRVVDGELYADYITCQSADSTSGCRSVYGNLSGLDQGNYCFTLGGGGCCGGSYLVSYDAATNIEVDLAASNGKKIRVEGTVSQNGKNYKVKAVKITK
jgi:hypothetical protein